MALHTDLGFSDEEYSARQERRYALRFNTAFWTYFDAAVAPKLPAAPTVVDIGCASGLFLRDISVRKPEARLYGFDINPDMIARASRQPLATATPPTFQVLDIGKDPLPLANYSADLVAMIATLYIFDDPFPILREAARVLARGGRLLIYDWVRIPLEEYIAQRLQEPGEVPGQSEALSLKFFAHNNRYTEQDWHWVFDQAGLAIDDSAQCYLRSRVYLLRVKQ